VFGAPSGPSEWRGVSAGREPSWVLTADLLSFPGLLLVTESRKRPGRAAGVVVWSRKKRELNCRPRKLRQGEIRPKSCVEVAPAAIRGRCTSSLG